MAYTSSVRMSDWINNVSSSKLFQLDKIAQGKKKKKAGGMVTLKPDKLKVLVIKGERCMSWKELWVWLLAYEGDWNQMDKNKQTKPLNS